MKKFPATAAFYMDMLVKDCLPFWQKNSVDRTYGGFFTCLDRDGSVYDTDKFIWLQGRQVWTFSMLYNRLEQRQDWLETAANGAKFLKKHGRAKDGNWYFSLNRQGKPLVQPYNIFSDCFAAMAFSQYALATGDRGAKAIAYDTYRNILKRRHNPKGKWSKQIGGTRLLKGFSLPMILSNLVLELEWMLGEREINETLDICVHEVMEVFYDKNCGLIFENVNTDGSHSDSFKGGKWKGCFHLPRALFLVNRELEKIRPLVV